MEAAEKINEQLAEAENQTLQIGDRIFRVARETTFRQDMFVSAAMLKAGLDEIDPTEALTASGLGIKRAVQSVLMKAYGTGQLFLLLAGTLVEDGVEWSEEVAIEAAQAFADAKDPKVKEQIAGLMTLYLMGFWLGAVKSTKISRKSSPTAPRKKASKPALVRESAASPSIGHFVADESSLTGTSSSES